MFDIQRSDDEMATRLQSHGTTVVICHALPGSGKTTTIQQIIMRVNELKPHPHHRRALKAVKCSADDYFTNNEGIYEYNQNKIHIAHEHCLKKFINCLYEEYDLIVVDNTNVRIREFDMYYKLSQIAKARVIFAEWKPSKNMINTIFERCVHNVPLKSISSRYDAWQDIPVELINERAIVTNQSIIESIEWNVATLESRLFE